ncbi:MAG: hypothetical protein LAT55_10595 [Opitutales bacterium]|nr:hypothetical protein [Opitutales bacterium]
MKKILFILLLGFSSWLYSSEESETCQLWLELSVLMQNGINDFAVYHDFDEYQGQDEVSREGDFDINLMFEVKRVLAEMVESDILAMRKFTVPHEVESEYRSMVEDFYRRLSLKYGAFITGELLQRGYWDSEESKEAGYFETIIRLPEDELKEFEKRFEALSD